MMRGLLMSAAALCALAGCSGRPANSHASQPATASTTHAVPAAKPATQHDAVFVPPAESALPEGPFGDMVRLGRDIFVDTGTHAKAYVGNGLSCSNCHLDAGRLANSAPLWGAYGAYPQYRKKDGRVNTFGVRMQGCFLYSMNGKAPALDSTEMVALETYAYWLASGAPVGKKLAGAGYPKQGFRPPQPPDYVRGEAVYEHNCALCHGADGQGQRAAGRTVFPPLWGPESYNWGAGMQDLGNAAAFIKANMPLSRGGSLTDQDAWDVAMFVNGHERPQDPRYTGSVEGTRKAFHDTPMSLYGTTVAGHLLGSQPAK